MHTKSTPREVILIKRISLAASVICNGKSSKVWTEKQNTFAPLVLWSYIIILQDIFDSDAHKKIVITMYLPYWYVKYFWLLEKVDGKNTKAEEISEKDISI